MEITESSLLQDQVVCNSIPHGGPIYMLNLVGPITRVAEFEASVVEELQSLRAELCVDSSQVCEDDLSVDELKIFTEDELVDKALKEAFQANDHGENSSQVTEELSNNVIKDDHRLSSSETASLERSGKERNISASYESLSGSLSETIRDDYSGKLEKNESKRRKKRGRTFDRISRASELENGYNAQVEQLVKVKQKQDEDKAAARLHSFNGSCKISEGSIPSSENIEKMASLRFITSATKVKPSDVHEHVAVSYPEMVLCVEIYHNTKNWLKTQEFFVLGRQTLTELRDQIYCLTDQLMQKAGQHDPSGYFLIEDVFCNDLRDPSSIDYSEPIFDWLRNSRDEALEKWEWILSGELQKKQKALFGNVAKPNLPQFKAVEMHKVRFCDLAFRLGAGYLYCHQGDCKHIIVIRDMRLIHPEDVQNRAAYPVLTFQLKTRFQKCSACRIYRATKVTVDDKWAQENPCYFCDNCYYLLHYTEDGSLLYDEFTVYDYHHE